MTRVIHGTIRRSLTPQKMLQTLTHFQSEQEDAYLYAGPIEKSGYDQLCEALEKKEKGRKALLYLITRGGNPNAGYRIARALIHHYGAENFRVAIPAECKSAGTLICIGAHSLVFFDQGELGPLDVQFQKKDEIFQQSSGLDILRGMTYLQQQALDSFNSYLLEINGGSGLSTKTASEIASNLVRGLFEPIFAQIDPIRLGEMNAALQIANEYGNRLNDKAKNFKTGSLSKLINSYPTHGFVIDRAEARTLFERVSPPTPVESAWGNWAVQIFSTPNPPAKPVVLDLVDFFATIFKEGKTNESIGSQGGSSSDVPPSDLEGGATSTAPEGAGQEQPTDQGEQNNG